MRGHEHSRLSESKRTCGRIDRRSVIQIDNRGFGGRSNVLGSVLDSERGGTATIDTIAQLRLALLAIGSTPTKWCKVQH